MYTVSVLVLLYLLIAVDLYFSDTHALVKFLDEDCTSIVPVAWIEKKDDIEHNGSSKVKWSNNNLYYAFLLFSGAWYLCVQFLLLLSKYIQKQINIYLHD